MLLQILMLPLLSAVTLGFFGRHIGRFGAMVFATVNMWLAACVSAMVAWQVASTHTTAHYNLGKWRSFMIHRFPSIEQSYESVRGG